MILSCRCIIAIFITVAVNAPAQRGTATLGGTVVNSLTGQPLRDAEVTLQGDERADRFHSASTAPDGTFQMSSVEPGRYILFAARSGYQSRNYSTSEKSAGLGTVLNVTEGATLNALTIRLNPMGAIAGRIVDEQGEPMPHVSVEAKRYVWFGGHKQIASAGLAATNDLGEYRIFDLPAGTYFIHAEAQVGGQPVAGRTFSFVPVYYPSSLRPDSAIPLELTAGQLQPGIDFMLRRVQTFIVQGHIAGAGAETMVYLAPIGPDGIADLQEKRPVGVRDAYFEIPTVIPGQYLLAADQFGDSPSSARLNIEIREENIRGVELAMARATPILGRVKFEGPERRMSNGMAMRVGLQPLHRGSFAAQAGIDSAGRFVLKGVVPGNYRLVASNVPAGFYVKALLAGDIDISLTGLDYTQGGLAAELTVVLSSEGGALRGAALNESGKPVPGVQVIAISAQSNGRAKQAVSDQTGYFEIKDLAPGEYRVLGFEDLEAGVADDGEFMKRFAPKASRATVMQRGSSTADVVVISAELSRIAP